jgi:hypothetical protein
MKTAVGRVGRGKERQVNTRFLAMTNHYVFAPEFCNQAAGWEKGQAEKNVQYARPSLWQRMPDFPNLMVLNDWLEQHCQELWRDTAHGTLPGSIGDVSCSSADRAQAKPTWRRSLASRLSNITGERCASSQPSNRSTHLSRRKHHNLNKSIV